MKKNFFAAIILGVTLAGASYAQTVTKSSIDPQRADKSTKPRIAVIEFSDATGSMTAEAKRQLQASIAFALVKDRYFDVPDVRNTRAATSSGNITLTNAAAIGKKLGVGYVLIGSVNEYSPALGRMIVRTQLVKVGTGKLVLSNTNTEQTSTPMTANAGQAEMSVKVVKPFIQKLTASLRSANL